MRINLKQFCKRAEEAGCRVVRTCRRGRCYIVDPREIAIVTPDGAVRIPIEQVASFIKELPRAIEASCEMWSGLSKTEKNKVAKDRDLSYGIIESVFNELGGLKHEQH